MCESGAAFDTTCRLIPKRVVGRDRSAFGVRLMRRLSPPLARANLALLSVRGVATTPRHENASRDEAESSTTSLACRPPTVRSVGGSRAGDPKQAAMPGRLQRLGARFGRRDDLTAEQLAARERWQRYWNLPILLAAFVPLFVTSPKSRAVEVAIGVGSWLVFLVDLVVQRRIVPDYLHRGRGRFDLGVVILTFPVYLIPGVSGYSAILLFARLGRVARVLMATKGLRRFAQRLGKVAVIAALIVVLCSLSAYEAEHPTNPGFATF